MARIPSQDICDKCKANTDYLPRVFADDNCQDQRLCRMCWEKFFEQYKLWCNDPQPVDKLPVKDGPFRVKKPWWKG